MKADRSQHDSLRPLRLLSYARVSDVRGRNGPAFISPTDQLARNRAYANAYGYEVADEGVDLDRSGDNMTRPVFSSFLARIRGGDADGLIVAKLDRFARSNLGALQAIDEIEDTGGVLISVQEQIDPRSASGRFMRSIFLATAQMERERIGEQWHVARSSAVKRGIHIAPHVPPGYVRNAKTSDPTTDRRLTPHPVHAETMRQAFALAAAGESHGRIADFLNKRELPSTSVKQGEKRTHWVSHRIGRLLANRAYLGEARSGDGITNLDAHPALVDEATFLLAQQTAIGRTSLSRNGTYLLTGIVRCASCSFAMRPQAARGSTQAVYRCTTVTTHGRCPGPSTIAMSRIDEHAIEQFLARVDGSFRATADLDDDEWAGLALAASAAEQSYRAQLANTELRRQIGDADHDELLASLHHDWQNARSAAERARMVRVPTVAIPEGITIVGLVEQLRASDAIDELRGLLGEAIEAIFVRPAASRARNLPVTDRVKIVFWGDSQKLELPARGRRFEPRPFVW